MDIFSGWQYLLIDACNQWGGDKLLFNERIQWAEENLHQLEDLAEEAETKPLYLKAVQAIRKAQQGIPTGHLVELDATCSGLQIMSAITGCVSGATATGLVNPDVRADAYTIVTDEMNRLLKGTVQIPRSDAKSAVMKCCYGSKKVPIDLFGKDTPELDAFYQAVTTVAPGPWELLQELLASWQPYAKVHAWKLPDGFDARVKVMDKITARIEVDELDHATFTYEFYENLGTKTGRSLAANTIHSIDAYLLRCMHRRCNYNPVVVTTAYQALISEAMLRLDDLAEQVPHIGDKVGYYVEQYERSGMADVVILPYLKDGHQTQYLSTAHIDKLIAITGMMLENPPFELVTIHDAFKAHPNNCNTVRFHYKEIMAELAESNILADLLSQIHGVPGNYPKLSNNLGDLIRGSNYSLS